MAVLWTFRAPSLCRHVHRELLRKAALNLTLIIPATACHQRNYVGRYSRYSGRYQILLLYLSHGLRETASPGVAALHAFCRFYNTLSLRFLTRCTLVPHAHSTLSSASVGKYFDLFMNEIYYKGVSV
jgi:hypothetical protein